MHRGRKSESPLARRHCRALEEGCESKGCVGGLGVEGVASHSSGITSYVDSPGGFPRRQPRNFVATKLNAFCQVITLLLSFCTLISDIRRTPRFCSRRGEQEEISVCFWGGGAEFLDICGKGDTRIRKMIRGSFVETCCNRFANGKIERISHGDCRWLILIRRKIGIHGVHSWRYVAY